MSDFNRDTAVAHVEELCREHNIEWVTEGIRKARPTAKGSAREYPSRRFPSVRSRGAGGSGLGSLPRLWT
jgi:hypothetical protein